MESDKIKFECDELRNNGIKSVTFKDSQEIHEEVFLKLLEWYLSKQSFNGESIMQNDDPMMTASEILGEIADDIIQFEVEQE